MPVYNPSVTPPKIGVIDARTARRTHARTMTQQVSGMMRPSRSHQRGFVISLEFVVIFTILFLALLAGCVVVRNGIIQAAVARARSEVFVKDGQFHVIAKPVSYDLCEAPQLLCRDPGYPSPVDPDPGPSAGLNALVGVRPDRFVTRNRIYFSEPGCDPSGGVFIAPPPLPPPAGVLPPVLPVGYYNCGIQLDADQSPVCYGVGPPTGWDPTPSPTPPNAAVGCSPVIPTSAVACLDGGRLYRSDGPPVDTTIQSVWTSLAPDCTLEGNLPGGGGGPGGCVGAPSGLVGWWPGDGDATDIAGTNNGSLVGGVNFVPGQVADAFNVVVPPGNPTMNVDYVLVANDPVLEPAVITVDAWVRGENPSNVPAFSFIVAKGAFAVCDRPSYGLWTGGGPLAGIQFRMTSPGPGFGTVLSPFAPGALVWDGAWHHVAGTFDGSVVRLYVDGVEIGGGTPAPGFVIGYGFPQNGANNNDLRIGAIAHPGPLAACQRGFRGDIDEVEIFDRALTAAEIAAIAGAGTAGKCKASGGGPAQTVEVCEEVGMTLLTVTPATEVLSASGGTNLLAPFPPLFNVMPPPELEITFTPPEPEAPRGPGDPPSPLTFNPPEPEAVKTP